MDTQHFQTMGLLLLSIPPNTQTLRLEENKKVSWEVVTKKRETSFYNEVPSWAQFILLQFVHLNPHLTSLWEGHPIPTNPPYHT